MHGRRDLDHDAVEFASWHDTSARSGIPSPDQALSFASRMFLLRMSPLHHPPKAPALQSSPRLACPCRPAPPATWPQRWCTPPARARARATNTRQTCEGTKGCDQSASWHAVNSLPLARMQPRSLLSSCSPVSLSGTTCILWCLPSFALDITCLIPPHCSYLTLRLTVCSLPCCCSWSLGMTLWELVDGRLPRWAPMSWYFTTHPHFPSSFSQVGGSLAHVAFLRTPTGQQVSCLHSTAFMSTYIDIISAQSIGCICLPPVQQPCWLQPT
jgi:hypothetical protein